MDDNQIDAEFFGIVEHSLADTSGDALQEVDLLNLIKAIAKMNELSTYLARYVLSSMMLGPGAMAPLGDEIMFGVAEVEKMSDLVLEDIMEFVNGCDCPDCLCECDNLPEDVYCDSCIRVENCECGLDGTCSACIEYELKHPSSD